MADNLTNQVRNIAKVTTAVAKGDLSQKITVEARGEILELKNTINIMVDQLNAFAAEVSRVAKEVGTEGKSVVRPTLKAYRVLARLTDNVNFMADNLQTRCEHFSRNYGCCKRRLSQKITVDAQGEISE